MLYRIIDRILYGIIDRILYRIIDIILNRIMDRILYRIIDRIFYRIIERILYGIIDRILNRIIDRILYRIIDRIIDRSVLWSSWFDQLWVLRVLILFVVVFVSAKPGKTLLWTLTLSGSISKGNFWSSIDDNSKALNARQMPSARCPASTFPTFN